MIRARCGRCGAFLARVPPSPGLRLEFGRCERCGLWPLVVVDHEGVVHELAFRSRLAMEAARQVIGDVQRQAVC